MLPPDGRPDRYPSSSKSSAAALLKRILAFLLRWNITSSSDDSAIRKLQFILHKYYSLLILKLLLFNILCT